MRRSHRRRDSLFVGAAARLGWGTWQLVLGCRAAITAARSKELPYGPPTG
jgi:hypothetical protein